MKCPNCLWKRWMKSGYFSLWGKRLFPSLHFCPDWDYLLIDRYMPEAYNCTCRDAYGNRECLKQHPKAKAEYCKEKGRP